MSDTPEDVRHLLVTVTAQRDSAFVEIERLQQRVAELEARVENLRDFWSNEKPCRDACRAEGAER